MTENHMASEHHRTAARHHTQAANYHHESSRHYENGEDYAHAAHQALIAHGHALLGLKYGDEAWAHYAGHHLSDLPKPSDPGPSVAVRSLGVVETTPGEISGAAHHAAAATHHEQAAHHHQEAAKLCGEKDDARAPHEAQMAHRHAHYSFFHDDEAAMHHVEHYGKSGQSAEIAGAPISGGRMLRCSEAAQDDRRRPLCPMTINYESPSRPS